MIESQSFYMYVLRCADDTLYTGFTTDVERRVETHNAGKGAKYTASRRPVVLIAYATFATKREAMSAEARFKHLSRAEKLAIIASITDDAPLELLLEQRFGMIST